MLNDLNFVITLLHSYHHHVGLCYNHLLTNSMEWNSFREADSRSTSQDISQLLWKSEGFLPRSQVSATGPSPETGELIPHLHALFL